VTVFIFVLMLSNFSFAGPGAYGITAIVVGAIGYLVIRWKVDFVVRTKDTTVCKVSEIHPH
jgi:hypothetical protein